MRESNSDRGDSPNPFREHVDGALAIGVLIGFYTHECYAKGIPQALANQNEYAIAGLAVLSVIAIAYILRQIRRLLAMCS